jgi:hypothetical protein
MGSWRGMHRAEYQRNPCIKYMDYEPATLLKQIDFGLRATRLAASTKFILMPERYTCLEILTWKA